jgi:hypothetical protein
METAFQLLGLVIVIAGLLGFFWSFWRQRHRKTSANNYGFDGTAQSDGFGGDFGHGDGSGHGGSGDSAGH